MKRSALLVGLLVASLSVSGCWREDEAKKPADSERSVVPLQGGKPIDAGSGAFLTPTEMAEKADVPLYPGAETPDGKSSVKEGEAENRYEILMTTPDPVDKVLAFYESKMERSQKTTSNDGVMGTTAKGNFVIVNTSRTGKKTTITAVSVAAKSPNDARR